MSGVSTGEWCETMGCLQFENSALSAGHSCEITGCLQVNYLPPHRPGDV